MDVVNTTPIRPVNLLDRGTGENIPESEFRIRIWGPLGFNAGRDTNTDGSDRRRKGRDETQEGISRMATTFAEFATPKHEPRLRTSCVIQWRSAQQFLPAQLQAALDGTRRALSDSRSCASSRSESKIISRSTNFLPNTSSQAPTSNRRPFATCWIWNRARTRNFSSSGADTPKSRAHHSCGKSSPESTLESNRTMWLFCPARKKEFLSFTTPW
jgi:hypothetical protein